jgi:NAD(P)-dependent dehydrogenase (short-subunit alcohol dehydrogenase family)/acyl carrier protein
VPPADPEDYCRVIPEAGAVLVTGGLGDVGFAVAEHLFRTRNARLVLTTVSALPPREEWTAWLDRGDGSGRVRRHLRNLLELERRVAQVLALTADVADPVRMSEVVRLAEERFGRLDAVVHGAGVSDPRYFDAATTMTPEQAEAHFRTKVHGFLALQEALAARAVQRITLSSLSCVLGGLGLAAYAAANGALDAYATAARRASDGRWLTVDWEAWRTREEQHPAPGTTIAEYPMTTLEGLDVFDRAWSRAPGLDHLVISSGPLAARVAQWAAGTPADTEERPAAQRHPRPELTTPYTAPSTTLEQRLADVWGEVLGIEKVGIDDVFFELGGHSLLATQLTARLKQDLGIPVPVMTVLQFPTVREFTAQLAVADGVSGAQG